MSRPTVSIVIPTFNRADLLPRAIESIIDQTYDNWEIVLVDDGSTDDTESVARVYGRRLGDRFLSLRQDHIGCCSARNRGIDACRGEFVAFLDSDDEFLSTKLDRQIALFRLRPELGFVYSDFAYIDLDGTRHESAFNTKGPVARMVPFDNVGGDLCVCAGSLFDVLLKEYFIATIVGMVRRDVLGGTIRFSSDPTYAEEWLFYLKVARRCHAGFVDAPLSLHHFVRGSSARTSPRRNLLRLYGLLLEMRSSFDDLTRQQRSMISGHLATTCRRLAYDSFATGDLGTVARHLLRSCRHQLRLRTLYDLLHVAARSGRMLMTKPRSNKGASASQRDLLAQDA